MEEPTAAAQRLSRGRSSPEEAEKVVGVTVEAGASVAVDGEEQEVCARKRILRKHSRRRCRRHRTHVQALAVLVAPVAACSGCAAHSRSHSREEEERGHSHGRCDGIRRLPRGMSARGQKRARAKAPYAGLAAARCTDPGHTRLDRRTACRRRRARTGARARVRHNHKLLWARFGCGAETAP